MENDMELENAHLYLEAYMEARDAGDDPMNARCRIIEMGCPVKLAKEIEEASEPDDE